MKIESGYLILNGYPLLQPDMLNLDTNTIQGHFADVPN